MDFDHFVQSRHLLINKDAISKEMTFCHAGTHKALDPIERVSISKRADGSCILKIENHCYIGRLDDLEKILWDWYNDDLQEVKPRKTI